MLAGCLRNSTFGSQLLYAHILPHSASVTRLDSHTSRKIRIYIKTSGFKPFRHTYLQSAILQSLLNHILTKNRGWGRGPGHRCPAKTMSLVQGSGPQACPEPPRVTTRLTSHKSPITIATGETRFPRHTSNPIGK